MKVSWKQFAQRRKINLEMFKAMSFEEYAHWCAARRVDPVSRESYESVRRLLPEPSEQKIDTLPEIEPPQKANSVDFTSKELRKMKKEVLQNMCADHEIFFSSKDTKRSLISKLLSLNIKK